MKSRIIMPAKFQCGNALKKYNARDIISFFKLLKGGI